ncbi:glutathione peroxidase [Paenibacillus odorifer]|uniref:glutathione peroxidase n=1 Tax=Paenibacillus TaxID=44249 RepID=UPI00096F3C0B|nr:glutathione peroxidase [Paenibacillus odorifer]OME38073.1 glutathione peroxidase [Paenibacillus odorifer]OME41533.1 glutathione peroxidase [Paenibacillus odorifer]
MSIYDFQAKSIHGEPVELSIYRGKVLLILNTASRCSYSRQLPDLQKLYEIHHEQGFEILGFPCNQFNEKEPESNSDVHEYCESNFGVKFPLFEKVEVRGPSAHPLFQYLTQQAPFQGFDTETSGGKWMQDFLQEKYPDIYAGDGVKWNFSKFLIDRNGHVYGRYETMTEPFDIEPFIESLLLK